MREDISQICSLMANDAFKTVKLVLHKSFSIPGDLLVTGFAGNFYVLAVKFKLRFVVVKFAHFPGVKTVTTGTIRHPELFELFVVIICMAA